MQFYRYHATIITLKISLNNPLSIVVLKIRFLFSPKNHLLGLNLKFCKVVDKVMEDHQWQNRFKAKVEDRKKQTKNGCL